ncbi:MAG: hypothetical protein HY203_11590 [Nitrospirae bacterium]|nr:hypothetical protein [Nitrospirota bacterium]
MKQKMRILITIYAMLFLPGCVSWHSGVRPIEPPGRKPPATAPIVDSLKPTLTWEPSDLEKSTGVEGLLYQLVIFKPEGGFSLKTIIAYEKKDISGTSHALETALEPNTRYYWRIRPIYKKDGQEITGDWNGFSYIYLTPFMSGWAFGSPYFFNTPEK